MLKLLTLVLYTGYILTANEVNANPLKILYKLDNTFMTYWFVDGEMGTSISNIRHGWCQTLIPKSIKIIRLVHMLFHDNKVVKNMIKKLEKDKIRMIRKICRDPGLMAKVAEHNTRMVLQLEAFIPIGQMAVNTYLSGAQSDSDMDLSELFCFVRKFMRELLGVIRDFLPNPKSKRDFDRLINQKISECLAQYITFMANYGANPWQQQCEVPTVEYDNPLQIQSPQVAFMMVFDKILKDLWQ